MSRAALFLDRDGTIIVDAHYASAPEQVVLLPGAATAIARANSAGFPVVVVTNQSGIGRGLITTEQFAAVSLRLVQLLAAEGAHIDASYHCPHWPERDGPCACRKPGIGMHQQAANDLHLSLSASAYIGDRFRDIAPAIATGGFGVLVPSADTPADDVAQVYAHAELQADGSAFVTLGASINDAMSKALAFVSRAEVER